MWLIDSPKVGANDGADEIKCDGRSIKPEIIPTIAVITIPIKIAAGTRVAIKIKVTIIPKIESNEVPDVRCPNETIVESLATIKPALANPIKAMNKPIPAAMATFKSCGIMLMIVSRILKNVSNKKIMAATKTPAIAVCQGTFIPMTTEYAKNALTPKPGAIAIG